MSPKQSRAESDTADTCKVREAGVRRRLLQEAKDLGVHLFEGLLRHVQLVL